MKSLLSNKILLAILAVVVIGGGAFFMTRDNGTDTKTNQSSTSSETSNKTDKKATSGLKLPQQAVGNEVDCSTYTLEEIAKIWGVPMTDTDIGKVSQTGGNYNGKLYSCGYNETNSGKGLSVNIEYREYDSEDGAKQYIKDRRDGAKFGETVYFVNDEVEGVGDEAFFSLNKGMADGTAKKIQEQLYARNGKVAILLSATNLDGAQADYREKVIETFKLKLN